MVRSRQNISLPRPAAARTADMYGLHRNLLSDSFLFNNQFRDSVGESEERTLLTHMNGRVNLDQRRRREEAVQCSVTSHHTDEGTMDFGFGMACGRESGSMRLRSHEGMNMEVFT